MHNEYRLPVTTENILVRNKNKRGCSLQQQCAADALDMHYSATAMQNFCITRNSWKGEARKGSLLQYCKQCAFYSKTSHAMTMKPHEIDIRGYEECSVSIT